MPASRPALLRLASRVRVQPETFCWEWQGTLRPNGYGVLTIGSRSLAAHRAAYELLIEPVPKGLDVGHLCGNRRCCNPAHLKPTTRKATARRHGNGKKSGAKLRNRTHCIRGHLMDEANTYVPSYGGRACRTCSRGVKHIRFAKAADAGTLVKRPPDGHGGRVEPGEIRNDLAAMTRFHSGYNRRSESECWAWEGTVDPYGYGVFSYRNRRYRPHRIAYEIHHGPIPDGLVIDHLCRNRACMNPAHLEAVTHQVNILRGQAPAAIKARTRNPELGRIPPFPGSKDER